MPAIGRNEPCPCGSGKKYKKCCLAKDEAARFAAPPVGTPLNASEDDTAEDDASETYEPEPSPSSARAW